MSIKPHPITAQERFTCLMQDFDREEELCAELRAIINDGDKAETIIANVRRKASYFQGDVEQTLAYGIRLLEEQRALALRGGYDNDYSVWRYTEDDCGVGE